MARPIALSPRRRRTAPAAAGWLLAAVLGAALAPAPACAEAPLQTAASPGWYRVKLGAFEVTALSDGTLEIDSAILKGAAPQDVERLLARSFQRSPNTTSVNAYLVNTGSKLVLIDAGAANLFGPTVGKLMANLKAAGYAPEQVDAVLITHLHPDHVGGIALDGQAAFPNATVHVDARESAHWLSADNLAAAPQAVKGFFQGAQAAAAPYVAAGRWKTFTGDAEIVPGIRAFHYGATPGHTPGHVGYLVASGDRTLLVWGDVVHSAAVQFAKPGVTIDFDADPKTAAATRARLYELAADRQWLIGAAHISFPGLGRIRKEGRGAYAWVPVEHGSLR